MVDISPAEGKSFYQSEPLIARLRGIIRDYPEGVGIIKELIQNADDAQATKVEITLDWRTHQPGILPDERMSKLMGPAMLVYNNQVFTDRDFDSIRSLGQSKKAQDLHKTGRFGVGFNAIYHVTDYPSFISRDRLIFFDPHGTAIPGTSQQEPGREWNLAASQCYEKCPSFMQLYEAGGLPFGTEDFMGTLFRLPLRTQAHAQDSEIRKQPFTEDNVRELITELIQGAEELLLFLKSVQEIHVFEIPANSNNRQEILSILTLNPTEVQTARQKIFNAIPDEPQTLIELCRHHPTALISTSYRHEIETVTKEQTNNSTWRVVNLIRIDEGDELAKVIQAMHLQQEKVLPWAGAAARISATTTTGTIKPVKGKVFCFLPLPLSSNLSIHINGFFNLNSSRDNLSSDSGQTGSYRPRAIWNSLLVRHVLAHACANLIVDLVQDIGRDNPGEFYQLWLINKITFSKALEELHNYVIQLLYSKPVVRSAVEHPSEEVENSLAPTCWVTPPTVKILPTNWQNLLPPLQADNIDIPSPPLPPSILSAFQAAGCPLEIFKPSNLRQHLTKHEPLGVPLPEVTLPSLRNQQWIVNLLRYCISDNYKDLRGLPLAILADETLQVFGYNPIGTIYIAEEKARQIFANYPKWFLHPTLYNQVSLHKCVGVTQMHANEVANKLTQIINSHSPTYAWQPDALTPPNTGWLTLVYDYFSYIKSQYLPLAELKSIPLVPGNDGKLYQGGLDTTPLLRSPDIDPNTLAALQYFGIKIIEAPVALLKAIAQFRERHEDQFVWYTTGPDVVDIISANSAKNLPLYDQQHYTSLLNFLADDSWLTGERQYEEHRLRKLRELRIFPTNTGEIVSLNEDNIYLPGDGYLPPEIAGSVRLLHLGTSKNEWLQLFQILEVPVLTRARLIEDCLLAEYLSLASDEQLIALTWIRDNLSDAKKELQDQPHKFTALQSEIKKARLVRCTDGRLRAVTSIYSPESEVVRTIIGDKAAIPDLEFYSQDSALWLDFFKNLGMLSQPNADDLLSCIDNLIKTANLSGADIVADKVIEVFNYIIDNWNDLKEAKVNNYSKKLIEVLKDKAWLAVERNPEHLSKYASAITPENRLYRSQDICFLQDAYLLASQKPIFARQQTSLIKIEIRQALGFQSIDPDLVLKHFETIINIASTNKEIFTAHQSAFLTSIKAIYKYLYDTFIEGRVTEEQRQQIQKRLQNCECLWDEATNKFWQPKYTFTENVPFFGTRRVTIPFTHRLGEVYQLLGQKSSPHILDYLDFLQELASEYNSTPLTKTDTNYTLQVLQRLEAQLALEDNFAQNFPILTADAQLRLADEVFIPDAPWRKYYISPNLLLHPQVSVKLAKAAGSLSLIKNVIEKPTKVNQSLDIPMNEWCQAWQRTLKSPEFITGLKRLIFHEYDSEPIRDYSWITTAQVLPASQISVDLFLQSGTKIASSIPGSYYFDEFKRIFNIACSDSKLIMLYYLSSSLNNQLGQYTLQNLLPLASIIDAQPKNINNLLNQLRIKALHQDNYLSITEDNYQQSESEQLGQFYSIAFYKWLGYTDILQPSEASVYHLTCTGSNLLSIQIIIKIINRNCHYLHFSQSEWSILSNLDKRTELLIVSIEEGKAEAVTQISEPWNTFKLAEAEFKRQVPNVDPINQDSQPIIEFSVNADTGNSELIIYWQKLLSFIKFLKIKQYQPIISGELGIDELVRFQEI
jgi:sacsin